MCSHTTKPSEPQEDPRDVDVQGLGSAGLQMHSLCFTHRPHTALTGHHTMLRPARKKPPTVPRLVEYIAWKKGKKKVFIVFQVN